MNASKLAEKSIARNYLANKFADFIESVNLLKKMNIKYLAYNLLKTDYKTFFSFVHKLSKKHNQKKVVIIFNAIKCLLNYNTRLLDYFYYGYFKKDKKDKNEHTNVWDMYLFQKKYNDKSQADIMRNKIKFREVFNEYFNYKYFILKKSNFKEFKLWLLKNKFNKIVCKDPFGTVGAGVNVLSVKYTKQEIVIDGLKFNEAVQNLYKKGYILIEEFILQHPILNEIAPQSVNTVRIVTFLNESKEVEIWTTLLRIGVHKKVDNFDAGGISALINSKNGKIIKLAVSKDPFNEDEYEIHPVTKSRILDVIIPYWEEIIEIIHSAAFVLPDVRTVGWDVAVTTTGPTLIEANDNWDKTHYELTSGERLGNRIKTLLKKNN